MRAVQRQSIENYWTATTAYEGLTRYITMNFEGLRDSVIELLAGGDVRVDVGRFSNDIHEIKSRDAVLLQGRPSMQPGMFKQVNNRAGDTVFVDAQLVQGTMAKGFQRYEALQDPVARAIFMMFMISEVHPFNDGNGRMARIMMNAELVHADQCRIIVPTVFRLDYLLTLRKLSRQKNPEAYIQVMQKLHAFSQNLYGSDYDALNKYLLSCNAYEEPENARLIVADRNE